MHRLHYSTVPTVPDIPSGIKMINMIKSGLAGPHGLPSAAISNVTPSLFLPCPGCPPHFSLLVLSCLLLTSPPDFSPCNANFAKCLFLEQMTSVFLWRCRVLVYGTMAPRDLSGKWQAPCLVPNIPRPSQAQRWTTRPVAGLH